MPFALSEITSIFSNYANSTTPSSSFNSGWFDTSKVKTFAAWAAFTNSNALVNSPHLDVHGAYDTNNPLLVSSTPIGANSGYVTYQGSVNNWPFPFARVTWQLTPVSSYPGSIGLFAVGKG